MKPLLPTLFCLLALFSFSQKQYKFPEKFNSFYDFKPDEAYKQIAKDNGKSEEEKKSIDYFAINYIYGEQVQFDYNVIYLDWVDVENYFIKILEKVLPKSIHKRNLNFFLRRSVIENAGTSRFGNIYFNIGMFCQAENEAFVAAVLAHEAGHYFFGHKITSMKQDEELKQYGGIGNANFIEKTNQVRKDYYKMLRTHEVQADTFAICCLIRAGINLDPLLDYQENEYMRDQVSSSSRSFKNMLKASALSQQEIKKRKSQGASPFATHPSSLERFELIKNANEKYTGDKRNFFVDSVFFRRLKNIAAEERKRITFENADYDQCASIATVDYLYEPKNIRNLYYLVESLRRQLIIRPELSEKGFLTDLADDEYLYYNNKSIFHKPELILNNYKLYEIMKDHPLVKNPQKYFETYEQGFLFFAHQARNSNLNEANLSLGLYYHYLMQKDSSLKYLQIYLNNGSGLYHELAETIVKTGKPGIHKGKSLLLYHNLGNYTGIRFNYYLAKQRRQVYNSVIRQTFMTDSLKTDLVLLNELLASNPSKLQDMNKLITAVNSLYNEDDIQKYKKIRLTSQYAGEDRPGTEKSNKHLFVYAPEWYNWFKEHNYDKVFLADVVYQYDTFTSLNENFNTYTGYYLDFNLSRPYFRDASRVGTHRKDKESEMLKEMHSFLYE